MQINETIATVTVSIETNETAVAVTVGDQTVTVPTSRVAEHIAHEIMSLLFTAQLHASAISSNLGTMKTWAATSADNYFETGAMPGSTAATVRRAAECVEEAEENLRATFYKMQTLLSILKSTNN